MIARRSKLFLVFVGVFVVSRIAFHLAGLGYSTEHWGAMMHFVDPWLLSERFAETMKNLHGQPPLMSLVMAGALHLFGDDYPLAVRVLFHLIGIGIGLCLIDLLLLLRFPGVIALLTAVVFSLLPSCVVYEHYFFFTHPLVFLLLLVARCLHSALERQTVMAWSAFFLTAAVIVNFKSMFHLAWLALLLPFAWLCSPRERYKAITVAFVLPFLIGASWYAKNWVVFGRFESSSWMGFGLARKTYHKFDAQKRATWVREGRLDPVASVHIYGSVADYAAVLGAPAKTGVPLLDAEKKRSGWTNFHHAIYSSASRRARTAAIQAIHGDPAHYFRDVRDATILTFKPSTLWHAVHTPYQQIKGYADAIDPVLHAEVGPYGLCPCMIGIGLLFLFLLPNAYRLATRRGRTSVEVRLFVFMVFVVLYVLVLGVFLDTGETNRYRLSIDGLALVSGLIALRQLGFRRSRSCNRAASG